MKRLRLSVLWLCALLGANALSARVDLLLVPPPMPVPTQAGLEAILYLNNPTNVDEIVYLHPQLVAEYATGDRHDRVRLRLADPADTQRRVPAMTRQTVLLILDEDIKDTSRFISLRLMDPLTNAVMFEVDGAAPMPRVPLPPPSLTPPPAVEPSIAPGRQIDLATDVENMRRHISGYDPIYFAIGWRERFNARFQFSFKYRVFERGPPGEIWWKQLARDVYAAYTQTSIWDLDSFSKPFYDSSYKPTVFLLHEERLDPDGKWRVGLQLGAQHESNGKGGGAAPVTPSSGLISATSSLRHPSDTRSFNTLYVAPRARWTGDNGVFVEGSVRASAYFQEDENPDITRFRGNVEATLRGGYDRGFQLSMHLRGHPRGHGSVEFNASWPVNETPLLKRVFPEALGGYAQIQYFNGYGESLLDYDVRRKDQLRFGMMIVR